MSVPEKVMRRVHIVGGPGSGKTTLAYQLAGILCAPCIELDSVGYEGGAGADRPMAVRVADIQNIAAQPAWVTEGIFLGWTEALFQTADAILWLDLPWRVAGWRIFTRHVRAELRGNNKHRGWLKLFSFMRWCQGYYQSSAMHAVAPEMDLSENRATTAAYLAQFGDKVTRFQTSKEVDTWIKRLLRHA